MTKVKAPLLGFGATGSLGNSLTYREKPGRHEVISIPTHPDTQTLPQVYQRWRFIDAMFYWASRSDAQKAVFRAAGSRHHLTAYQECLRQYMILPFDQVLWLRMDTTTTGITPDSSKHENHATVIGASPAAGIIDHCLSFDGINDLLNCGNDSSLVMTTGMTVSVWVYLRTRPAEPSYMTVIATTHHYYNLYLNWVRYSMETYINGGYHYIRFPSLDEGAWHHLAYTFDSPLAANEMKTYYDGVPHLQISQAGIMDGPAVQTLYVGGKPGTRFIDALIDDTRLYNRALSAEHINYIATKELYPVPA